MARNKKKFSKKKKIVITVLSIVGIIILSVGLWAWNIWRNVYSPISEEKLDETKEITRVFSSTNDFGPCLNPIDDSQIVATSPAVNSRIFDLAS